MNANAKNIMENATARAAFLIDFKDVVGEFLADNLSEEEATQTLVDWYTQLLIDNAAFWYRAKDSECLERATRFVIDYLAIDADEFLAYIQATAPILTREQTEIINPLIP